MQDDETLPTPPPRKRNPLLRLLGFAIRAPLGCMAFFAGLATVIALAAPMLASSTAARWIEAAFDDSFAGRFSIEDVRFSWVDEQGIDEFVVEDPDGVPVAKLDARFPSLMDLARGGFNDFGRSTATLEASLVRFEDGSWNWQRAIGREPDSGLDTSSVEVGTGDEGDRAYRAELALNVARLTVEDRLPQGAEGLLEIEDLVIEAALKPGQHTRIDGVGRLVAPGAGEMLLSADLGLQRSGPPGDFPFEAVELTVESVPVEWVDRFLQTRGLLVAAVGRTARLELSARTRDDRRTLTGVLELVGEHGRLRAPVQSNSGRVRLMTRESLELTLDRPQLLIERLASPELLARLDPRASDGGWSMVLETLEVDTSNGFAPSDLAASLAIDGRLDLGGLSARPLEQGERVALSDFVFELGLAPGAQPSVIGSAGLEGGGSLRAVVIAEPLGRLLAALEEGRKPGAELSVVVDGLPTATVDALAASDGLVGAILGATVDMDLAVAPAAELGDFELDLNLRSPLADSRFRARLSDGALVQPPKSVPLETTFALTPLSSPRVVGPLIPFLSKVETVPGGERARLTLDGFRLPLDGDLSGLSGDLTLGLGDVRVSWIPGLSGLAGFEDERLGPYRFAIRDGRATYTDMPISVDGERFPLTGSVGLVDRSLELSAELPLRSLGSPLRSLGSGALDALGSSARGDLRVPITFGRQPDGQVRVDLADPDFLQQFATDEAASSIERELDELLRVSEELGDVRNALEKAFREKGLGGLFGGGKDG